MLEIFVDGASAGNPGKSGIGIFIRGEGHSIQISEPIEPTDNHTAEFQALLRGLEEAAKLTTGMVSIRSDSQVVVHAVEKKYVKNENYNKILTLILKLSLTFDFFFIKWIPDEKNRAADALARKAVRQQN